MKLCGINMAGCLLVVACVANVVAADEKPYQFRAYLEEVHKPNRVDSTLAPAADEFVFTDGCVVGNEDFADYLKVSMRVKCVHVPAGEVSNACVQVTIDGARAAWSYTVDVTKDGVKIVAADARAANQAYYHLEDLMNLRKAPFLKFGHEERRMRFSPRMLHSGWGVDVFPDGHLKQMAHYGFDAILVFVKEVGKTQGGGDGDEVKDIIARAKNAGIDTYLYTKLKAFVHPDDPHAPEVFKNTYGKLAATYPEARGIVFVGESCEFPSKDERTTGKSHLDKRAPGDTRPNPGWFPCRDYPEWITAVRNAVKKEAPRMEVVFWTYNWTALAKLPAAERYGVMKRFPEDVIFNFTCYKNGHVKHRNGFLTRCDDYTISFVGPADYTRGEIQFAKENKRAFYMMANTGGLTWDFGTIPYEPFPYQWKKRWDALKEIQDDAPLGGLMESHHFGWWPSVVSELAKEAYVEGGMPFEEHILKIAERDFGKRYAKEALRVWKSWSEAICDYTASNANQYGPFRIGPAYPFAFGGPLISPLMGCRPAPKDAIPFPEPPKATHSFGWMCNVNYTGYASPLVSPEEGAHSLEMELPLLETMEARFGHGAKVFAKIGAKDEAILGEYLQRVVRTAMNIKEGHAAWKRGDKKALLEAAQAEYANARAALKLLRANSRLGWEPSMEYAGGIEQVEWKLKLMEKLYGPEVVTVP